VGSQEVPFSYGLGDSARPTSGARAVAELGDGWRSFALAWHPRLGAPQATLYLWQHAGAASFEFDQVWVAVAESGHARQVVDVPGQLRGSIYDQLTSEATRDERRYVRSRVDAARLAFQAFKSEPLRGIGWATFPVYSAAHANYGQLAAHDQYLSFAAELGIVGLLLLGLLLGAIVSGVRQAGSRPAEAGAVGLLAAAATGIVFVEALPVPQLSIPIAIGAAIVCVSRPRKPTG
jgi:hypothetical protein